MVLKEDYEAKCYKTLVFNAPIMSQKKTSIKLFSPQQVPTAVAGIQGVRLADSVAEVEEKMSPMDWSQVKTLWRRPRIRSRGTGNKKTRLGCTTSKWQWRRKQRKESSNKEGCKEKRFVSSIIHWHTLTASNENICIDSRQRICLNNHKALSNYLISGRYDVLLDIKSYLLKFTFQCISFLWNSTAPRLASSQSLTPQGWCFWTKFDQVSIIF